MSRPASRSYKHGGALHAVRATETDGVVNVTIDDGDANSLDAHVVRQLSHGVELLLVPGGRAVVVRDGDRVHVAIDGRIHVLDVAQVRGGSGGAHAAVDDDPFAASPMTGVVLSIDCAAGDEVEAGSVLFKIEAMKMEFAVEAPRDVTVASVDAAAGDRVDIGQVVVRFEEQSS